MPMPESSHEAGLDQTLRDEARRGRWSGTGLPVYREGGWGLEYPEMAISKAGGVLCGEGSEKVAIPVSPALEQCGWRKCACSLSHLQPNGRVSEARFSGVRREEPRRAGGKGAGLFFRRGEKRARPGGRTTLPPLRFCGVTPDTLVLHLPDPASVRQGGRLGSQRKKRCRDAEVRGAVRLEVWGPRGRKRSQVDTWER